MSLSNRLIRPKVLSLAALLAAIIPATAPLARAQDNVAPSVSTGSVVAPLDRLPVGEASDQLRVQGSERLYSVEKTIYGVGRTTISKGDVTISADRMVIDTVTEEVQAEGNVLFVGPGKEIRASSGRYSFRNQEGVAFDVEGVSRGFFFRKQWDEEINGPSFRRIDEDQALFRGAYYTTSGFPVPTYYIAAKEIIVIPDNRWFMKSAVLWVRGVPMMYFPVYTRAFDGGSPWSVEVGARSSYGAYLRLGYQFIHETKVPDWENPEVYRTRSTGKLGLRTDLFSGGAIGVGMKYDYQFDFKRHIGSLDLYGVRDNVRDVDAEDHNQDRYYYRHRHNSMFGKTIWQLNADWMSDPDIYYDLADPFEEIARGRLPERRIRGAVTYLQEDWLARISTEFKERVTLGRYADFAEPKDDNLNYDPDPDFAKETGEDTDGISRTRYGRVSEKYEGRVATRLLPFFGGPFYWHVEANAFSNLDAGFNELSQGDDERVSGGDVYASLTHRTRLDGDGRFTWLNTVGVGVGSYDRSSDRLVDRDREKGKTTTIDGLTFYDGDSVFISNGSRKVDYGNVNPVYAWADYSSRLNARFTDNVSGYLKYTVRQGTRHHAGEFYEQVGRLEAFEDIYDFPVDEHWIEGFLRYSPLFPKITTYLAGGYNLQSRSNKFANERLYYVETGAEYESDSGEWMHETSLTFDGRQARDREDPNDFQFQELSGHFGTKYIPQHGRYWLGLDIDGRYPLEDDPVGEASKRRDRYSDEEPDVSVRPLVGRQFGPKYDVEVFTEYNTKIDGIKEAGVIVRRDVYDADIFVFAGIKNNSFKNRDKDSGNNADGDTELDFRVGLKVKRPDDQAGLSAVSIKTLRDRQRQASFVE